MYVNIPGSLLRCFPPFSIYPRRSVSFYSTTLLPFAFIYWATICNVFLCLLLPFPIHFFKSVSVFSFFPIFPKVAFLHSSNSHLGFINVRLELIFKSAWRTAVSSMMQCCSYCYTSMPRPRMSTSFSMVQLNTLTAVFKVFSGQCTATPCLENRDLHLPCHSRSPCCR